MSERILEQFILLHSLVRSLSASEISVLKNFLVSFESRQKGFKPKGLVLTELILKHDDPKKTFDLFRKKLGKNSLDAARVQAQRLRDKVYETLLLDINLKKMGMNESAMMFSNVIKKRIQIGVLAKKGHRELTDRLYRLAIDQAKKREMYADLIDILIKYRRRLRSIDNRKLHARITGDIEFYQECLVAVIRSQNIEEDLWVNYRAKGFNTSDPDGAYLKAVQKAIGVLEPDFEYTGSAMIGVQYYTLNAEALHIAGEFEDSVIQFKFLLDLLKNNPAVMTRTQFAQTHLNIVQSQCYSFNFHLTNNHLEEVRSIEREKTSAMLMVDEQEFYVRFYNGEIDNASKLVDKLISEAEELKMVARVAKLNYFGAVVSFCKGNLKNIQRYLSNTDILLKDRQGFNLAMRIFGILLSIEKESFDLADSQIVNLRQFMHEGLKNETSNIRNELILTILVELRKQGYNFTDTLPVIKEHLEKLFTKQKDLTWVPQCAELICFHLWFIAKLRSVSYDPKLTAEKVYSVSVYNI